MSDQETGTEPEETKSTTMMMSLVAFGEDEEQAAQAGGIPEMLRISNTASYVSFFTGDGVRVDAHYLEEAEDWSPGYVQCTGDGCPACAAGINRNRFLLLPVVDRVEGKVKLLRVPAQKGPGKLLTEIMKIIDLENRDEVIAKITREGRYAYLVEPKPAPELDPEIRRAVQRFNELIDDGGIDLTDSVTRFTADEMADHPKIAQRLRLEGVAK
jgi:hypothetical protein